MLSEATHLGGEGNQRLFSCWAQILRWRSELALSVAEGMTGGTTRTQSCSAQGLHRELRRRLTREIFLEFLHFPLAPGIFLA
jgi:hypothetical protein